MTDLPVVTCPHGRHPGVRCRDCESRVFTEVMADSRESAASEVPRCSEHSIEGRCPNVGKFVLLTDGGEVEKMSCRHHLAGMVCDLRSLYQMPVMVDLGASDG